MPTLVVVRDEDVSPTYAFGMKWDHVRVLPMATVLFIVCKLVWVSSPAVTPIHMIVFLSLVKDECDG